MSVVDASHCRPARSNAPANNDLDATHQKEQNVTERRQSLQHETRVRHCDLHDGALRVGQFPDCPQLVHDLAHDLEHSETPGRTDGQTKDEAWGIDGAVARILLERHVSVLLFVLGSTGPTHVAHQLLHVLIGLGAPFCEIGQEITQILVGR